MRPFPARFWAVSSIIVILLGIVYGSMFAGIPYQDPTPKMSADYDFHLSVSGIIVLIGFGMLFLSIASAIAQFILKKLDK